MFALFELDKFRFSFGICVLCFVCLFVCLYARMLTSPAEVLPEVGEHWRGGRGGEGYGGNIAEALGSTMA